MQLTLLKSKLHRATVTAADLNYEGSITIPRDLMDAAGLVRHEQVDVLNVQNGERFTTYVIEGEAQSGVIQINGPAARRVQAGDLVVVCAYAQLERSELPQFETIVLHMNADNSISRREVIGNS